MNQSNKRQPVTLVFDDGPSGSVTSDLLVLLESYGCQAAFFPLGKKISGNQARLRRAQELGHIIGTHGWSHARLATFALDDIRANITRACEATVAACGTYPVAFRPPYGSCNDDVRAVCDELNLPIIWDDVQADDIRTQDSLEIAHNILACIAPHKILALHELDRTVEALAIVLPQLKEAGYTFEVKAF